jgi:hypothetical protein
MKEPWRGFIPSIGVIARITTGRERITESQNLRARLFNSELSSVGIRGSSAIPHFGQSPGASLRISGCIGQVKSESSGADVSDAIANPC